MDARLANLSGLAGQTPPSEIGNYGVTFDHLVPTDKYFPEVLRINICEMDSDDGEYANTYLPFTVDPTEYIGKKVLAVPRCCQKRKGTTDRSRVNGSVTQKDLIRQGFDREAMMSLLIAYGIYTRPSRPRSDSTPSRSRRLPRPRAEIKIPRANVTLVLFRSLELQE